MSEIVIRHCVFRVVRHGGWTWGADRRALVERFTQLLPQLLAERLSELFGDADGEITEPIKVAVKLDLRQPFGLSGYREAIAAAIVPSLLPNITSAEPERTVGSPQDASCAVEAGVAVPAPAQSSMPAGSDLQRLLLQWREQGDLQRRLRGFGPQALRLWLAALAPDGDRATDEHALPQADMLADAAGIATILAASDILEGDIDRLRLVLAVELLARHRRLPPLPRLLTMLDQALGAETSATAIGNSVREQTTPDAAVIRPGKPAAEAADARGQSGPARVSAKAKRTRGEVQVSSVLPWLALGMLRRVGWLDVATAAIDALALPDRGAVLAAAIATKLTRAPRHGWYRDIEALRTIAAFAGLDSAPAAAEYGSWSRLAQGGLSPLDAFLASEIGSGHSIEQPLFLTRQSDGSGFFLLDADGCVPAAWETSEAALLIRLAEFGPSIVMASAEAATPELLRGLQSANRTLVTDARPGRGEQLHRVPGLPETWMSPAEASPGPIVATARRMADLRQIASEIDRAFIVERPLGAPGATVEFGLERTATLAATAGLGLMAWLLWRDKETTDPLMALERLGDLEGSARFEETVIEIRPSVGRHYLDLKQHRLLGDIPNVAWLGGRTIRFMGP